MLGFGLRILGGQIRRLVMLPGLVKKHLMMNCQKLSGYSIKQTIVQPDFNDNNTLIDSVTGAITIIDLGEIVISHPFFSLLNCLQQIKKHHALAEENQPYQQIKDAYLKHYMTIESRTDLSEAFSIAELLWIVYGILAQYRLIEACGIEKIISLQPGKLRAALQEWMTACGDYHSIDK